MSFLYKISAGAVCVGFLVCIGINTVHAQTPADTSGKLKIQIIETGQTVLQYIETDSGAINKLVNNVVLKQDETFMYCDSAYINFAKNNVQAFGSVKIVQPGGTQVESDYLRYTGNNKKAYLKGNVNLTDGKTNLWSDELEYNLGTKIGTYEQGGTLQSDVTTVSSNIGMYNVRTKDARFKEEVIVTDPEYNVTSEDLGYNTESKVVRFFGPSIVVNDKSELRTSSGTWDAKNEIAHFTARSSLQNKEQYIEADVMDYDRNTGFGKARGNVITIDTAQHITMYCGYAQYNEITRKLLAVMNPVMKKMNGVDSLFIRADTFFSAPIPFKTDTLKQDSLKTTQKKLGKNITETTDVVNRTASNNDSTVPRYFIGYHHVLVYGDSLQAKCDSISYSQADSILRLIYDPVAWSRNSQITGDTILLYLDSNKMNKLYVPNNALIVSQSGPDKAKMYDQVQGKTLTGYFENNAITQMVVWPNAESIYYSKDDADAYIGVNQAESERMKVFFEDRKISRIVLEQGIKQTMTPMQNASIPNMRLSRFQWLIEQRPKSVRELFDFKSAKINDVKEIKEEKDIKADEPKPASRKQRRRNTN